MMCAYHTLCPLTRSKLFILFFLPLLFFLPFVCLPAFHAVTQSLSEPLSHQHFSLSLSHSIPHMVMLVLAEPVLALMSWRGRLRVIGVFADVHSHTCLICRGWTETLTLTSEGPGKEMKKAERDFQKERWNRWIHRLCMQDLWEKE